MLRDEKHGSASQIPAKGSTKGQSCSFNFENCLLWQWKADSGRWPMTTLRLSLVDRALATTRILPKLRQHKTHHAPALAFDKNHSCNMYDSEPGAEAAPCLLMVLDKSHNGTFLAGTVK